MQMIEVDGAQGEGGGQILRTTLAIAMCLGKAVRIKNIRAGRAKPGLLRQHLACVNAAKQICGAEVSGAEVGSTEVRFIPGEVRAGCYHFAVGTAGSTTLILQTVLMPLALAQAPSEISFEGGTHNAMAPSFDFIALSFAPLMKLMGVDMQFKFLRHGFYPAGGGAWQVVIAPHSHKHRLALTQCEQVQEVGAVATTCKIPAHVGERELAQVAKRCALQLEHLRQQFVESVGPGNVISIRAPLATHTAVFEAFAERNVSAEKVANKAVTQYLAFRSAEVAVCEHLADQLVLPLALVNGGEFTTSAPSQHLTTNIAVIKQLTGVNIELKKLNAETYLIKVAR